MIEWFHHMVADFDKNHDAEYIVRFSSLEGLSNFYCGSLFPTRFGLFVYNRERDVYVKKEQINSIQLYKQKSEFSDVAVCQSCGTQKGYEKPHTCPYQEEIDQNFESNCNCCDDCISQCSYDI